MTAEQSLASQPNLDLAALPGTPYSGNAAIDGPVHRGWLVGHFMPAGGIRHSDDVEIKWGVHPKGDERSERVGTEHRTTVVLLVTGRFRVDLDTGPVVLEHTGDYLMYGPGVGHSWCAEESSVVITIRWPSGDPKSSPLPRGDEALGIPTKIGLGHRVTPELAEGSNRRVTGVGPWIPD